MIQDFENKLEDAIKSYQNKVIGFSVSNINPSLIENHMITGENTVPIKAIAAVNTGAGRTLEIKPWQKDNISVISRALKHTKMIESVETKKDIIICHFPEITTETRENMAKELNHIYESIKNGIRHLRQKMIEHIKAEKLSEDNEKKEIKKIDKITEDKNLKLKEIHEKKRKEILGK